MPHMPSQEPSARWIFSMNLRREKGVGKGVRERGSNTGRFREKEDKKEREGHTKETDRGCRESKEARHTADKSEGTKRATEAKQENA